MSNASYATAGFSDRGLGPALDAIAAAGFSQAELLHKPPHVPEPFEDRTPSELRAVFDRHGVRARTVHAPTMRVALGVTDEEWRRENVEVLAGSIRFAGAIGATDIVIHPIPNPMFVADALRPDAPRLIGDAVPRSLDDLVPVAEEAGVRIMLENLPYDCDYPYLTMQGLRPLVDRYPADWLGLVIDTGHVGVLQMDPVAEIRTAGDRLMGTHIHDVDFSRPDGDHRPPTHGGLDWDAIRRIFAEIAYPGPWTFEVAVPCHDESQEEMARITREVATAWGM
jgi:sugar phosphate isomerase/epimerase